MGHAPQNPTRNMWASIAMWKPLSSIQNHFCKTSNYTSNNRNTIESVYLQWTRPVAFFLVALLTMISTSRSFIHSLIRLNRMLDDFECVCWLHVEISVLSPIKASSRLWHYVSEDANILKKQWVLHPITSVSIVTDALCLHFQFGIDWFCHS